MKKITIISILAIFLLNIINTNKVNEEFIRIRVLANSNTIHDQEIKENVSKDLKNTMYDMLKDKETIKDARNTILNNINTIENTIESNLINEKYSYNLNYGYNYFPQKEYNGKTYKEGEYESLLVTLGKGEGNNWWCILFPPLCLLEAEESSKEIEYSFFLEELIYNIFH